MNTSQKIALTLLTGAALVGGLGAGIVGVASAQSASTDTTATVQTTATAPTNTTLGQHQFDPHKGGHIGRNGVKEVLLTGDDATKATTAALAAVPGATVERVETDAEGAAYEAHMTKADGSHVTVKFDTNFNVTGTETGMGHGMHKGMQANTTSQ